MKIYSDFHNAILKNDTAHINLAVKPHSRLDAGQQFAIYSDGYRIRLAQAIRSDYPILFKLLGDAEFDSLALAYIEQNPPTSYNLDFYPHKFAEFVSRNYNDTFSVELATLEATIAEVFMLPDSEPLSADSLSGVSAEDFGEMRLKLRTAHKLLRFNYQISDWLTAARSSENNLPPIPSPSSSWLLVLRHNNEVQRHNLSAQEFSMLQHISSGKNVSDALDATLDEHESHAAIIINNLQGWFANWVTNGVFCVE
jgi:hypothetical protein